MHCSKCDGKGWLLYQKPAPSPPYDKGVMLDYGVRCDNCHGASRNRKSTSGGADSFS